MRRHIGTGSLLALALLTTCSSISKRQDGPVVAALPADAPSGVQQAQANGTPVDPAVVAAHNGTGLALFAEVRQGAPEANHVLSPLSLGLCLGMIYDGSSGSTRAGMAQAMHLGTLTPAQLDRGQAALMASLYTADPKVTFLIANSVWARTDVLPSFLDGVRTWYGARTGTLEGAPATVNAWVSDRTQGKIPTLLDPALDCSGLDAILVNAIYFKGLWSTPFQASLTVPAPFTRADGTRVTVPMMNQEAPGSYGETSRMTLARLPYGNGRYGMVFVQPKDGVSLADVAASLDAASWKVLTQSLASARLTISLPRFTCTWAAQLRSPLTRMGMGLAFDPARADFSAMASKPLYLDFVIQKTTVAVDESGTTASAATGGGLAPTSLPLPRTVILDRPFLYAVQDASTGELLFFGQMMDPS